MDVLIKSLLLCFNMLYSPLVEYTPELQYVTIVKVFENQHGATLLVCLFTDYICPQNTTKAIRRPCFTSQHI